METATELTPTQSSATKTIGVGGAVIYGGQVQDRERSPELRWYRKFDTYDTLLRNVHIISACITAMHVAVSKPAWFADPADEDIPLAVAYADFVNANIERLKWKRFIRKQFNHEFFGFAAHEWTAARQDNGWLAFEKVQHRNQRSVWYWLRNDEREIVAFKQWDEESGNFYEIPLWKCIYSTRQDTTDSPYGEGLMRAVVPVGQDLRELERLERVGYQNNLNGIPSFRWPEALKKQSGTSEAELSKERAMWANWLQNHVRNPKQGLMFDSAVYENVDGSPSTVKQYELETLTVDGGSEQYIEQAIRRKTLEIARVLGVEHILVGDNGVGSQSLSRDKSDNFMQRIISYMGNLQEDLQDQFVGSLAWMNAWQPELVPVIRHEPIDTRDIDKVTAGIRDIATASGPIPQDSEAIGEVFDMMGLTRPEPDEMGISLLGDEDSADNFDRGE